MNRIDQSNEIIDWTLPESTTRLISVNDPACQRLDKWSEM